LSVSLLVHHGEWKQLLDLECDPSHYETAGNFANDYLVTELLQKSKTLKTGIDTRQVAVDGFWEAEDKCRQTNFRFSGNPGRESLIWSVGTIVRRVLPPLSKEMLDDVLEGCRHGPGASTSVKGTGSVPSDKYDAEVHLTPSLVPFARALMGDRWANFARKTIVRGSRYTTVPKNAKKDRSIAVEPGLNVFLQLGIGRVIRRNLRRVLRVDLNDQTWNQFLASKAQEWHLATIDLSMASDMISSSVVRTLLPPDWLHLLEIARSPSIFIGDDWHTLEKFSSMGNGYTFELESLLFAAILYAIVPKWDQAFIGVYGDDLIIPSLYAGEVVEALEFFGFKVNGKKTCLAGRFFESCGTDWFDGQPVRPFYCRKLDSDGVTPYPLRLANALRDYAYRRGFGLYCDSTFKKPWDYLRRKIPGVWCQPVPPELGDVGLISDISEFSGRRAKDGLEGWFVPCVQLQPQMRRKASFGRLMAELARIDHRDKGGDSLFSRGREPIRGYLGRPVTKRVLVCTWTGSLSWR